MQAPGSPLEIRAAVGMPFFPTLCLPSLNRLQQPQLDFGKLAPSDLPTWQLAALQIRPCIFLVLRLMEKGEARCLKEYIVFSGDVRGGGACSSVAPGTKQNPSVDLQNCLSIRVPLSSSFLWILLFSHSTNKGYLL